MKNRHGKTNIAIALLLAVAFGLGLGACSPKKSADPRVLNIGNGYEPGTLDPHKIATATEDSIVGDMFVGLTKLDAASKPVPGMAESWTISKDGRIWTFKLREALWSDGQKVTAEDVVFSFRRIFDPRTASFFADMLYDVEGAEAVTREGAPLDTIGVVAIDAQTVQISLKNPNPFLPNALARVPAYIVPKHIVETFGNVWVKPENFVSNGPFLLKEWRTNDYVRVVKNQKYYDAGKVCLTEVVRHAAIDLVAAERRVRAGELDASVGFEGSRLEMLRKSIPNYVRLEPSLGFAMIRFNLKKSPFDDVRVRQAFSMTIDRDFIANKIIGAGEIPMFSIISAVHKDYRPGGPIPGLLDGSNEDRLAKARALLDAAGYGPNKPLSLELVYPNFSDFPRYAPVLQAEWSAVAPWVQITITGVEVATLAANNKLGNFQFGATSYVGSDDPAILLGLFSSVGELNYGKYSSLEYDRILGQAKAEADPNKRSAILRQAELVLMNDAAVAPLYSLVNKRLVNPRITGWVDNPLGFHRAEYLCTKEALAEGAKP